MITQTTGGDRYSKVRNNRMSRINKPPGQVNEEINKHSEVRKIKNWRYKK